MSKIIRTVCGDIRPCDLGLTSMHEHILNDGKKLHYQLRDQLPPDPRIGPDDPVSLQNIGLLRRNFVATSDAMDLDDEETMAGEVADFYESGGRAIAEMSVVSIRRDIRAIRRISNATGVHVVASTGYYVEDKWLEERQHAMSKEEFYQFMRREVEQGVEDSGIRPGHLKIGISTLTAQEEKTLRAAARLGAETGLSLTVHPGFRVGGNPLKIVELARSEGLAPERLVIAHMGGTVSTDDLRRLVNDPEADRLNLDLCHAVLGTGANISFEFMSGALEMEPFGGASVPDWKKLCGLRILLGEGYGSQIVLGTDTCAKVMARRFGGEGYCRLTRSILPMLRQFAGVSDYAIRQMTVENPARILAFSP